MGIKIVKFRKFEKNTLRDFADIELSSVGSSLHDCCLHRKNANRWISLPAKPFEKDGETSWIQVITFSKKANESFQRQALAALDAYLADVSGGDEK